MDYLRDRNEEPSITSLLSIFSWLILNKFFVQDVHDQPTQAAIFCSKRSRFSGIIALVALLSHFPS